jgi:hypothetical protein
LRSLTATSIVATLVVALAAGSVSATNAAVPGPVIPGISYAAGSAISPDGTHVTFVSGSGIHILDTGTQTFDATYTVGTNLLDVAYSADGSILYVVDGSLDKLYLLDAATGAQRPGSPVAAGDNPVGLAVHNGIAYISSASTSGITIVNPTVDPITTTTIGGPISLHGLALSSDGSRGYAGSSSTPSIAVVDTASGTLLPPLTTPGLMLSVAVSPDGSEVYGGSDAGSVFVLDPTGVNAPATIVYDPAGHALTMDMQVSPDGRYLYVVGWILSALVTIDLHSRTVLQTLPLAQDSSTITISADGLTGYTAVTNTGVQILDLTVPTVRRLAGLDRIATAVEISKDGFGPGVPVVYVATAMNFPDALSAGAAAAELGGPLLLVPASGVPTSVSDELARLEPGLIVVVGGTSVVPTATYTALSGMAGSIRRDAGDDRYATSRIVTANAFTSGADVAYIATGADFPDALSASAAAAHLGAPVILVPGSTVQVSTETAALLTTLGVDEAIVVGGTSFPDCRHAGSPESTATRRR